MLDVAEERLLKVGLGLVVVGIEKAKHILEHTAGGTRCGNKLHHLMPLLLVGFPCLNVLLLLVGTLGEDAFAYGCCAFELEEGETLSDLF